MENGKFIDDFPIKTTIYRGFSMAMLNNQMVHNKYHNILQYIKMPCQEHSCPQTGWHGLKMSNNVWRCPHVSHHVWHDLLSQALWSSAGGTIDEAELSAAPLPVTSASTALVSTPPAKLCIHTSKMKVHGSVAYTSITSFCIWIYVWWLLFAHH